MSESICDRVAVFRELAAHELLCTIRARSYDDIATLLQTGWLPDVQFNKAINPKLSQLPQAQNLSVISENITLFRGMSIEEAGAIVDGRVEESGIHYTNIRSVAAMYAQIRNGLVCEISIPTECVKYYIATRHHEFIISGYSLKQCRPFFYEIDNTRHCRNITYSEIRARTKK